MTLLDSILAERKYQDDKWGGPSHDDLTETPATWRAYIREYSSGTDRGQRHDFKTRLVKTAALALAALESYYRIRGARYTALNLLNESFDYSVVCSSDEASIVENIEHLVLLSESNYPYALKRIIALCQVAHS